MVIILGTQWNQSLWVNVNTDPFLKIPIRPHACLPGTAALKSNTTVDARPHLWSWPPWRARLRPHPRVQSERESCQCGAPTEDRIMCITGKRIVWVKRNWNTWGSSQALVALRQHVALIWSSGRCVPQRKTQISVFHFPKRACLICICLDSVGQLPSYHDSFFISHTVMLTGMRLRCIMIAGFHSLMMRKSSKLPRTFKSEDHWNQINFRLGWKRHSNRTKRGCSTHCTASVNTFHWHVYNPLPLHCWMCLDKGLLSELLSLWHAFATDIYMKAIGLAGNYLHW